MALSENPKRPDGFEDKLENLKLMKKEVPTMYSSTVNAIMDMAEGGDPDGVREQYYPGWENADFEDLLTELGESK